MSQNPLPGSNVILVNTAYGGAADIDGFYSLVVPIDFIANSTALIKASFIGYRSATDTIRFTGQKEVSFVRKSWKFVNGSWKYGKIS